MDRQMEQLLSMIQQPAFLVKGGQILWHNPAAKNLVFCDQQLSVLLEGAQQFYDQWDRENLLQIDLKIMEIWYTAKVRAYGDSELFVLLPPQKSGHSASAMLSISAYLRRVLHELMNAGNSMLDQLAELDREVPEAANMNRALYQLLRLCGQLSDSGKLVNGSAELYLERTKLHEFMQDFADSLGPVLEECGWHLEYIPCDTKLRGDLDRALIQRALYNLVSNSLRHTPKGSALKLQVTHGGSEIYFTLSHDGETFSESFGPGEEQLGLGDPDRGVGLGMELLRSIARLHGGTLMYTSKADGTGVVMTFSIRKTCDELELKSPSLAVDDCSGLDHSLVELSDVLDRELYHPDRI